MGTHKLQWILLYSEDSVGESPGDPRIFVVISLLLLVSRIQHRIPSKRLLDIIEYNTMYTTFQNILKILRIPSCIRLRARNEQSYHDSAPNVYTKEGPLT